MTFRLLIQERKKFNVPIPLEIIAFNKARWLQHEKELDLIQSQFKSKLLKLQKMLISYKSSNLDNGNHGVIQSNKKMKKKVQVFSNINKSIQLDKLIELEMDRQSTKYDFNAVLSQNQSKINRDLSLVNYMDIILQNLRKTIDEKASILELQRQTEKHNFEDYYTQLDELALYRSRAFIIEQAIEGMQISKTQQQVGFLSNLERQEIVSIKLCREDQDQDLEQELIISEQVLRKMKSIEEEQDNHRGQMLQHFQFQQKVVSTVQREQKKIGVTIAKKPIMTMDELSKYLKYCKQKAHQSLPDFGEQKIVKKKRIINPSNIDQLPSYIREIKTPNIRIHTQSTVASPKQTRVYTQYTVASPKQVNPNPIIKMNQGKTTINLLIQKCNSMHSIYKSIDRNLNKQMRRQNLKMTKLDKKLEAINSNFLENKMILI